MKPEVPPKIKDFISSVTNVPLENIEEPLKGFVWDFDKGDFNHWVDLFNHFDSYFEKHTESRKDLQIEDNFLDTDPPFPKEAVLQILRVIRIILENCTNKHSYSSSESLQQNLSTLLACTDSDVVEACLQTLAAILKNIFWRCSNRKYSRRGANMKSKLYAIAQGWKGKDKGLGLISCALKDHCDPVTHELGSTLHFEFCALKNPTSENSECQGLQIVHLSNVNKRTETDLELLSKLVAEYKVPGALRFSLLTRLRFSRAFGSLTSRQQYVRIRLYAFIALVHTPTDNEELASFLNTEPEFGNELVLLLSHEDAVPEKIRILCLLSLVAFCQIGMGRCNVSTAVTSGVHLGILSNLTQKAVESVIGDATKWSVAFAEALLSLLTVFVSLSSTYFTLGGTGFIPIVLPLLKDTNPQHLHLVTKAVRFMEFSMEKSNSAATLFRDLGGLENVIARLNVEVSYIENSGKQIDEGLVPGSSTELDDTQLPYSEAMVSHHRQLLMKALLRVISLGIYVPRSTTHEYEQESLLHECLCIIFKKPKDFGGGVFSSAAEVMSDLIHHDQTRFPVLENAGLPSAFLDAVMDGVQCSTEAILCIPQCLDALCDNSNGLQAVRYRNTLRCFVKIFTSRSYLRALAGDTPLQLSNGLDELMRHAPSLRAPGIDMLIEILNTISKIGSGIGIGIDGTSLSSDPLPMETRNKDDKESPEMNSSEQAESSSDPSFLPDYVINAAGLLESILQTRDRCRIFIEKNGIEAVLELFTLPLMPVSVSVGQSISFALTKFSSEHCAILARAVCLFMREYLKSTNEVLVSVGDAQISARQTQVVRCLSILESILSFVNCLLKWTTPMVTELGTEDAKELGNTYSEVMWQIYLLNNLKTEEKEPNSGKAGSSSASSSHELENKSGDDVLVLEILNKLASTLRSFYTVLVKGRGSSDSSYSSLAKVFLESLTFSGHSNSAGLDSTQSLKCRYLGAVVDDMAALTLKYTRKRSFDCTQK